MAVYYIYSNDGNDYGLGADLTKTLLEKPWMGNRCMDPFALKKKLVLHLNAGYTLI
jgi:hypothetical protein